MRVDVHAHHLPARYMSMLREGNGPVFGAAHVASTLDRMVEGQDEGDISVQILSTGPNSPYLIDQSRAVAAAREVNDRYFEIVERFDGRFAAFGSLPLPHAGAAAAEAVRCLDVLNFTGIHLGCSALGRSLDDPAFAEVWSELDARAAIIYVHPGGILCGTEPGLTGMTDPGIAVSIGSAAELATAALLLVGLTRRYRRVRVIIGLLGGSLPFLLQRAIWLGNRFKSTSVLAENDVLSELRRFFYDVNLLPDPAVIGSARSAYGLDSLLFGSDAPSSLPAAISRFMRDGGLSTSECDQILVHNPAVLFGERLGGARMFFNAH